MVSLSPQLLGASFGLVAAVSLSIAAVAIRRGSSTDDGSSFDALLIVLSVNVVTLVPIALVVYYPNYGLTPRSVVAFAAAGLVGTAAGRMGYYKSIELVGASRAEPVKSSMPLFATIFAVVVLGELVSSLRWLGIAVIIGGIAVISWELAGSDGPDDITEAPLYGFALGVGAALLFGLEPILAKIGLAVGTPSLVGLVIKTLAAAVVFFVYAAVSDEFDRTRLRHGTGLMWYLLAGLANTSFLASYYLGLSVAPVSVVTPLMQTTPLFVALLSYLFLPDLERLTRYVVVGVVLVVVGATVVAVGT